MQLINVDGISKEYRIVKKEEGLKGAVKNLFIPNYTKFRAVDNISFSIEEGNIVGFIGPNGAGKSTTIKMMVGVLSPTSGTISVNGVDPFKERKKNAPNIGIVFGQRTQLWWDIPVKETYKLLKKMYNITDKDYKKRLDLFSEVLDITSFINKPTRQLSLGQRVRADMCAALLHNPKVLFLDEPTIGLDVVVKEKIHEFLMEINRLYHTTVILTTHDISDIETLSKKIIVIDHGNLIYNDTLSKLKNEYSNEEKIAFNASEDEWNRVKTAFQDYNVRLIQGEEKAIFFQKQDYELTYILETLISNSKVQNLNIVETNLESVIKNIYNKSGKGDS